MLQETIINYYTTLLTVKIFSLYHFRLITYHSLRRLISYKFEVDNCNLCIGILHLGGLPCMRLCVLMESAIRYDLSSGGSQGISNPPVKQHISQLTQFPWRYNTCTQCPLYTGCGRKVMRLVFIYQSFYFWSEASLGGLSKNVLGIELDWRVNIVLVKSARVTAIWIGGRYMR